MREGIKSCQAGNGGSVNLLPADFFGEKRDFFVVFLPEQKNLKNKLAGVTHQTPYLVAYSSLLAKVSMPWSRGRDTMAAVLRRQMTCMVHRALTIYQHVCCGLCVCCM